MTLSQLVEEAKQGNLAAQQGLFNELYDKMWYVCRRYIKDEWDAEEVLQDGFYNFFKGLSTFKYISDEAMWLHQIIMTLKH
jgi:RNA polymerase sigma-70 factor (ECF subfamily)